MVTVKNPMFNGRDALTGSSELNSTTVNGIFSSAIPVSKYSLAVIWHRINRWESVILRANFEKSLLHAKKWSSALVRVNWLDCSNPTLPLAPPSVNFHTFSHKNKISRFHSKPFSLHDWKFPPFLCSILSLFNVEILIWTGSTKATGDKIHKATGQDRTAELHQPVYRNSTSPSTVTPPARLP